MSSAPSDRKWLDIRAALYTIFLGFVLQNDAPGKRRRYCIMPLKTKLLLSFLFVVALTGSVVTVAGIQFMDHAAARQARNEVDLNLKVALEFHKSQHEAIRTALVFTSIRPITVRGALTERDRRTLNESLSQVKTECGLDVLVITDAAGAVVLRLNDPGSFGDDLSNDDLVARVLQLKKPLLNTAIWGTERVLLEMPHVSTGVHGEAASDRAKAHKCLLLLAAAPVLGDSGDALGVLYGGILLNCECCRRKFPLVDSMRDTIFREGGHTGIVSIVQDDNVVATSLTDPNGNRITHTLSGDYNDGETSDCRHERYFAAGEWFIGASKPLRNLHGDRVGLVHVAASEKEYAAARRRAIMVFLGITACGMIVALAASFVLAGGVLRPLRELSEGVSQLGAGNLDHRVKTDTQGPLSSLAATLNRMADSIKERDLQIKKNAQEMVEAQRLANLGQLAAGVAHEVNNPLGAITVYAHLLSEDLPPDTPGCDNVRKIIRETDRCKKIVKDLLDYSRQGGPHKESADINTTVSEALNLVAQQSIFKNVAVKKNFSADLPPVNVDVSQMEQVFINIFLNAAEAMEGNGVIDVATYICDQGNQMIIRITDAGPGIPPEHLEQVFEPFFTSKPSGRGTGLGLAISRGIVGSHGGSIRAVNNPRGGATFFVALPPTQGNT